MKDLSDGEILVGFTTMDIWGDHYPSKVLLKNEEELAEWIDKQVRLMKEEPQIAKVIISFVANVSNVSKGDNLFPELVNTYY